mgnify:CR=1 FL=1
MLRYILSLSILISSASLADIPNGYYDTAIGKLGLDLKAALHSIIDGQTPVKYTISGNKDWYDGENVDVWEALVYTDSACPEYRPKCGRVEMLYLDESRAIEQANRGSGANDSWDREHVWPKSRGFKNESQDGYTDLHHLRPADRNINGAHSNYGYDEGGEIIMDKLADGTEVATTMRFDKAGESFEPSDKAKGQVARMIFYMATRYEIGDDGGDEKMPDLEIKDENKKVNEPWIGDLCTLVKWNNQFPVTEFESRRNDKVYEIQGNRNPFIDNSGWVNIIWADSCN